MPDNEADQGGIESDLSDPDREAEVLSQLNDARKRLLDAPAENVVVNHAIGLYEFAALHLSAPTPDLHAAALAIDGFACLVEGLSGRLGPEEATLRDALANIRLAFVQIKQSAAS